MATLRLGLLEKDKHLPRVPGDYMARMGMFRSIGFDSEAEAWRYPLDRAMCSYDDETQEDLDHYVEHLPLVVPGLEVVEAELRAGRTCGLRGWLWFTWSRDAMWARIREVLAEYGVADERLAYMQCSGVIEPREGQMTLPGVVIPERRVTSSGPVMAAWTVWGLKTIDSGFCQRICHPDRGGPGAIPYSSRRCVVGNDWWLVGSRGDSKAILSLEIQASPLDVRTQANLLDNLRNYQ